MKREQKTQMLLDMQEHPEQFTEQALKTMLDDPEVRELMEATAQLKQAMINEENMEDNVDAEWQRFEQATLTFGRTCSRSEKQMQASLSSRLVASFIGILMMSGIAFAAIHLWSHTPDSSPKGERSENNIVSDTVHKSSPLPLERSEEATPVRYDEATLEKILTDMAEYYGLTLSWKSEDTKALRLFYIWNKQLSASESMKQLNSFERFRLELNDSIITVE